MIPMPGDTLDIALEFLTRYPDCYLFPIRRLEKAPPLFKNELERASNDIKQIKSWAKQYNGPNWGIALKKSHLVVIDVDNKPNKNGQQTLDSLELLNGVLPETLTVTTPSGGTHLYYSEANGVRHRALVGKHGFGEGVDSTNYVLVPGCWLSSGRCYQITHDAPIAETPEWFAEYLPEESQASTQEQVAQIGLDKQENVEHAIHYLTHDAPPSIEGRNGEHTLLLVAGVLKDMGIGETLAVDLLAEHYNVPGKCEPLWQIEDGELADRLDVKVHNAYAYLVQTPPGGRAAEAEFTPVEQETLEWVDRQSKKDYLKAQQKQKVEPWDIGEPTLARLDGIEPMNIHNRDALYREWIWSIGQERFINRRMPMTRQLKTSQFDSIYNYMLPKSSGQSMAKLLFKTDTSLKRFWSVAFVPGAPHPDDPHMPLNETLPGRLYNVYRPSLVIPKEGDTSLWNEHINYLFQNEDERNMLLNWMAWILQNPTLKPNHALLIIGKQTGTGKSLVARILEKIVGKHNTQRPKNSSMGGDFNSWLLNCRLCIVEEVYQPGRVEKLVAMRDLITEPRCEINMKGVPAFLVDNYVCVLGVSNHNDALPLDEHDRRWLVLETFATPKGADYYARVFGLLGESNTPEYNDPDALSAIYYELLHRDLTGYSGYQRPVTTEAKRQMIELSRSDAETWLNENMNNPPLSRTVVTVSDILEAMPSTVQRQTRVATSLIPTFLRDKMNGVHSRHPILLPDGRRSRVWVLRGRISMFGEDKDKLAEVYKREHKGLLEKNDVQAADDFGT